MIRGQDLYRTENGKRLMTKAIQVPRINQIYQGSSNLQTTEFHQIIQITLTFCQLGYWKIVLIFMFSKLMIVSETVCQVCKQYESKCTCDTLTTSISLTGKEKTQPYSCFLPRLLFFFISREINKIHLKLQDSG